ncbi:hypothetical protein Aca07nite_71090 [Actinoplanes capillaceus]|uniref:DUF2933 domain-containing protein n=1 Tax=Actinoplanes campanulatus TaxID=113559 RepID=A0ABQ3WU96_9ACTN|nr:DUF2933 domain-containing protein [Actinoplanes capillaceus]GID49834.1 hypothetical protein Aca07nite_71090 [Actinoplanes capillaceus]
MRRQPWGLYAIAVAILVVGLIALGVPANTLLFGAFLLACPLMMMFMMGGMHGGHGGGQSATDRDRTPDGQAHDPFTDGGSAPVRDQRSSR